MIIEVSRPPEKVYNPISQKHRSAKDSAGF
jgi:hypothetical protein